MRIGIVCYPLYGGSGVVATELGKSLAQRGHIVHFITYDRPVRLEGFVEGVFYHEVIPSDYPLFRFAPYESALIGQLVKVVQEEKLEILHVHYAIPHAISAFVAQQILKQQGIYIPFITTLHGTDITLVGKDEGYAPVVRFSLEHSNGITAVSQYLKQETQRFFQLQKTIEVIPNFVNLHLFKPLEQQQKKRFFTEDCEAVLMHVSNFRPVKRVGDVVKVFAQVVKEVSAKLFLIGDGPERPKVERLVKTLGIQKQVYFLGKQQYLEELLPHADVFLLTSENESFGLAALEAMACGVPVVAYNVGGLKEIIINEKSGFLVPFNDLKTFVLKVLLLLKNSELKNRMANAARAQAEQFSHEKIVPLYEQYYAQVLKQTSVSKSLL